MCTFPHHEKTTHRPALLHYDLLLAAERYCVAGVLSFRDPSVSQVHDNVMNQEPCTLRVHPPAPVMELGL